MIVKSQINTVTESDLPETDVDQFLEANTDWKGSVQPRNNGLIALELIVYATQAFVLRLFRRAWYRDANGDTQHEWIEMTEQGGYSVTVVPADGCGFSIPFVLKPQTDRIVAVTSVACTASVDI